MVLHWGLSLVLGYSTTVFAEWHSDTQSIMGTEVSVTLWTEDARLATVAIARVMDEMQRIDATLSPYKEDSALSKVNRLAAKEAQALSDEFVFLIDKSLYFSRVSHGAFDITFASVGRYYDYRNKQQPSNKKREALLPAIDYHHLLLDKKAKTIRYLRPEVYIDLGGIAKGYAVDRAAGILASMGITHASISAGGDSRILGDRRGRPWMVGIKNPRISEISPQDSVIRMPLENVAVSTSGDYERYFIDDATGQRIHHIINPKTGKSTHGVVSVTILGEHGVDTDPLSTTVFVLGVKKGLALINQLPGFDCVIIDASGQAHYSEGLMAPGEASPAEGDDAEKTS
ncbi:FAD:protein FMN transferase [Thalassocella blandensis]|nr:FAD:protein FMN transferase [Thalassocella blandensis]